MKMRMIRPYHTISNAGLNPSAPLPVDALDRRSRVLNEVGLLDTALKTPAPQPARRALKPSAGRVVFRRNTAEGSAPTLRPRMAVPRFRGANPAHQPRAYERARGFNMQMRGQGLATAAIIHRRIMLEELEKKRRQDEMIAAMRAAQNQTRQVPQFRRVPAPANQGRTPLSIRRLPMPARPPARSKTQIAASRPSPK